MVLSHRSVKGGDEARSQLGTPLEIQREDSCICIPIERSFGSVISAKLLLNEADTTIYALESHRN